MPHDVTQADREAAFNTGLRLTKREWIEVYEAFAAHRIAAIAEERARVAPVWRNAVTNTAIVIDLARKKHAAALKRNKAFAAFDADLNAMLDLWFKVTRRANPTTYDEGEQAWKDAAKAIERGDHIQEK